MNTSSNKEKWFRACAVTDVPDNGGVCVKFRSHQIALFHFTRRNEWFASENMCPHKKQMAISRGMLGSYNDEPKVACPFHKKTFSLINGRCMNSEDTCSIPIYAVKIQDEYVYIDVADLEDQKLNQTNTISYEKSNN